METVRVNKPSHSWVVKMLKMGSLGLHEPHPGSTCLEVGCSRWVRSSLRKATCNQPSKTRMTTSFLLDLGRPAALLSAGHYQERLLGRPLWPFCSSKFLFEAEFVLSNLLMKKRVHKARNWLGNSILDEKSEDLSPFNVMWDQSVKWSRGSLNGLI